MNFCGDGTSCQYQGQMNQHPMQNPFNCFNEPRLPYASALAGYQDHAAQFTPLSVAFPSYQPLHQKQKVGSEKTWFGKNKRAKKDPVFLDYCDVCDRGFKTAEKKREHYEQHVKCPELDCEFEAHFKIVEIHRRNLHGPNGLKIKLDTPEDIIKWREERRKKFPTKARVQEKLEEEKERFAVGAVIPQESFGKFRRGKAFGRGRRFQRGSHRGGFRHGNRAEKVSQNGKPETADDKVYRNEGNPLDFLVESDNNITKDDEDADALSVVQPHVEATGKGVGGLSQLMASYGSEDDSCSESDANAAESEACVSDRKPPAVAQSRPCKENNNAGRRSADSVPSAGTDSERPKGYGPSRLHKDRGNKWQKQSNTFQSRLSRPSLLRKLLEPEIRRERNDVLQCVRYIVEREFFDECQAS